MPVFLERFIIPLCAAAMLAVVVLNPMKLDVLQRVLLIVIILAIAALAAYTVHTQKTEVPIPNPKDLINNSGAPEANPTVQVPGDYSDVVAVVRLGGYRDFSWGATKIRVEVKGLVKKQIPLRHGFIAKDSDQVDIHVNTGGGLVFGGQETTYVSTNEYLVPPKEFDDDEPRSVYFFYSSKGNFKFFRVVVDHINPITGEITLGACFVRNQRPE